MRDAENLAKLVNRADPSILREALKRHYEVTLPKVPPKQGKKATRTSFANALSKLDVELRRKLDNWAERINLLTDVVGREAVTAVRRDRLSKAELKTIDTLGNEYDRSLWLFSNMPTAHREALDLREIKRLRRRQRCHSGYAAPRNLTLRNGGYPDSSRLCADLAEILDCPADQVAVELFERKTDTGKLKLYHVSIHHNLAPEVIECVRNSQVETEPITRAESIFVTYEPDGGGIHVLSRYAHDRGRLAKLVANELFQTKISGAEIPVKRLEYQCLARPFEFDISGEPVDSVKVTLLSYSVGGRTMEYRIGVRNPRDIHELARQDIGPEFRFDKHRINAVRITVHVMQQPGENAHSVHIELRGEDRVSTKSERESDRVLCDRLLKKWEIAKDVDDDIPAAASNG